MTKSWYRASKPIFDLAAKLGLKTKKDGVFPAERHFIFATAEDEEALYSHTGHNTLTEVKFMGNVETFSVERD